MATLVDTPAITTVLAPRLRSNVGTSVPLTGERPPMRVENRSLAADSMPSISSVPGPPGDMGPGPSSALRAVPRNSGAFVLAPRRSARVAAMQCRIPQPAARPVVTNRFTFSTKPISLADSARAGRRLRSPMTPFWHSCVRTTVDSGATRSASCMTGNLSLQLQERLLHRGFAVVGRMLDDGDHPRLHEPGGAHHLAGAGDLGDLDHAPAGRGLDAAAGAGGDDVVGAGLSPTELDDDFDAVT